MKKSSTLTTDRLPALDLVRCVAMFMMVQGHVIYELTDVAYLDPSNILTQIWLFIRGLTAPTFLFVSGAVQVFANKRDGTGRVMPGPIKRRLKTSLMLLTIGYLLVFPAQKVAHLLFIGEDIWLKFFQINILQLIAVSILMLLLFFVLFRNEKIFGLTSFAFGMFIFLITPFVMSADVYDYLPVFIAPFFSYDKGTLFAVTPFTGFMFLGAAFGVLLKSRKREKRLNFMKKFGLIAGVLTILASFPIYKFFEIQLLITENSVLSNPGFALLRLGIVLLVVALLTFVFELTKRYASWYSIFGRRALFVYVLHLILIYGTPWNNSFGQYFHQSLPLYISIPVAWSVVAVSGYLAWLYDSSVMSNKPAVAYFRYSVIFFILFILLV